MNKFTFDTANATQQYLTITAVFATKEDSTEIQLPSWRPGRYELGDFAKNVRNFKVFDDKGKRIDCGKISKDRWAVDTSSTESIKVSYQYYASELNAGSTYLDAEQLYVNPVNCCVYLDGSFNEKVEIELLVPDFWDIACSMKNEGKKLFAENMEELFDSPLIVSPSLQHRTYQSGDCTFYIWFNGESKPDWERVLKDFKGFTDAQVKKFIEFPVNEYHFLVHILPYKAYHGVEHLRSTVITIGPTYEAFNEQYKELLGVSSHELYHSWNIKSIRPIEMQPYDYTKENYSRLGYLCEGVTTYMGDLFLLKGGVFSVDQFFSEFKRQLQRHFDNPARFNTSVADSSYDTWLDGYVPGTPGRKVSIYTEGALLSMVIDVRILRATGNKYGIDEVMKRLYFNFAMNGKGVSDKDYRDTIEAVSGESFEEFFADYINGNKPFESIILDAFEYLGLELIHVPSKDFTEAKLGMKTSRNGKNFVVKSMYSGGPAELGGMMLEDEIISINGFSLEGELEKWCRYFEEDTKTFAILRQGRIIEITLPEVNRNFYMNYDLKRVENPTNQQMKAFEAWIN